MTKGKCEVCNRAWKWELDLSDISLSEDDKEILRGVRKDMLADKVMALCPTCFDWALGFQLNDYLSKPAA